MKIKINIELSDFLDKVIKPARYIGNEYNQTNKDLSNIKFRIALCYPDIYEIGMSNLGWKILYHLINKRKDSYAERVFVPWLDMEKMLNSLAINLFTLETKTPLILLDMIGFSLLYELCYTNIITVLKSSGIPVLKEERKEYHPLIIAGGACTYNPEPLSDIIDLFVIGDGEKIINEIIDTYLLVKKNKSSKKEILKALSAIKGIYVAEFYEKNFDLTTGLIYRTPKKDSQFPINKRITDNLNEIDYPTNLIVPHMETTHDRISIEIMRGCERGCRFCHAGLTTRPLREKSPSYIIQESLNAINSTGYDELSFSSLSTGDYPYLHDLLPLISNIIKKDQVAISLPSLFPASLTENTILDILKIRKTGITIAPEAATENLRKIINKPISNEDIFKAAEIIFKNGWQLIKLYFMIGIPGENENDIAEIAHLANEISKIGYKIKPSSGQLNITISSFVPKAHTPFQYAPMNNTDQLIHKQNIIKKILSKNRKITLKFHDPFMSQLEAIFARGDSKLNSIIYQAWLANCRLDGWNELFNYNIWLETFNKMQLDPNIYLKQLPTEATLPWDHISTGVNKKYLISQWQKSLNNETTKPTSIYNCNRCGVCNDELLKKLIAASRSIKENIPTLVKIYSKNNESINNAPAINENINIHNKKIKYRIIFSKLNNAAYLSHLDLYRNIKLILKRSHIPVSYSEGFHPMPRISMGLALSTGIPSKEDFFEIILYDLLPPSHILASLNAKTIDGLTFISADPIPLSSPAINPSITHSLYSFLLNDNSFKEFFQQNSNDELINSHSIHWNWFYNNTDFFITKIKTNKTINLLHLIDSVKINKQDSTIYIRLKINQNLHINILELLNNVYPNAAIPSSLIHLRHEISIKGKSYSIKDFTNNSINIYKKISEPSYSIRALDKSFYI